jgi:hypothetical protein
MTQELMHPRPEIVPLQWHEAVAVVQIVARQLMASGEDGPVPAAADLAIDHKGGIHIVDSPEHTNGDGPAGLGALLRELLQFSSSTPPALRSLADETEEQPAKFRSVEDFSRALQFFERPLSEHALAAHAARLATMQEQHRLDAALEQLTQKARDAEAQPEKKKNDSSNRRRTSKGRRVAIAVLLSGFLIVALFAGALAGSNSIGGESIRETGSRLVERVRSEARAILSSDSAPTPAQPSAPVKDRPPPSRRRSGNRLQNPLSASALPAIDLPVTHATDARVPLGLAPEAVTPGAAERARDAVATPSVYSSANGEVEPPLIMRPQIRSEPAGSARGPELATLVLDINEQGGVSQVRLASVSAEQRYYAAMMVAAAKAWRFRPAHREGRPVRYRLRLRVSQ